MKAGRRPGSQAPLLNIQYLSQFEDVDVPLELTRSATSSLTSNSSSASSFTRTEAPLSTFLSYISHLQSTPSLHPTTTRIYLAQCPVSLLPSALSSTLPTPTYALSAGRGDIYDSSIWLGLAPTLTPLHKDPNENVFVQLAGRKVVRVFEPAIGAEMFATAMRGAGGGEMGMGLGEEMMSVEGEGGRALNEAVWGNDVTVDEKGRGESERQGRKAIGFEAVLEAGDGMFIPKGWWHSVRGVGSGIIGSANWWFR